MRLLLLTALATPAFCDDANRPNVIVIFTDDQGYADAGCYGSKDLETPGIDRLAKQGLRFTQFYAAAPVCSPSRAGLLTGRYPVRAGVPGNVSSAKGNAGMPQKMITMADVFKKAGYKTAHVGKWHLGYTRETMPNGQGFDFSFGHMGGCIDNYSHFFYWNGPNRHDLWKNGKEIHRPGKFFLDLMLDEAKAFITQNKAKPFFMYFALNCPHYPYQGELGWLKKYAKLKSPRNLYAAFVSTLDARIDALVKHVDDIGLRQNTIIVFQSDHGYSREQRAHFGGGSAGKYRGAKFSLFEGGIRVPAVISWPGHIAAGKTRSQVAHSCDWMPTLCSLAGIKPPAGIDGKDLSPVIKDGIVKSPHDVLHWTFGRGGWAVRRGDWKLMWNVRDTGVVPTKNLRGAYLVNLKDDPSEKTNLAGKHADRVKELRSLHDKWAAGLP